MTLNILNSFLHVNTLSLMETLIIQLRCVMRNFLTHLIMNYLFELFLLGNLVIVTRNQ
jgi:hypothetical protein